MPKCRWCGAENKNKNYMYKVQNGKQSCYFCSESHYISWKQESAQSARVHNLLDEIFGYEITSTMLYKELNSLYKTCKPELVADYLDNNKKMIVSAMESKTFSGEYNQIRYVMAIIRNNIRDYSVQATQKKKEVPAENVVMDFGEYKHVRRQKKSLMEVMREIKMDE